MHIICKPYNLFRGALVTTLGTIIVVLLIFFMGFFQLPNIVLNFTTNWPYLVTLLCLVQFDITLGTLLTKLIELFNSLILKKNEIGEN